VKKRQKISRRKKGNNKENNNEMKKVSIFFGCRFVYRARSEDVKKEYKGIIKTPVLL
jgi:hypothetical protein